MMHDITRFEVTCDAPGCCEGGGEAETEAFATANALDSGFVERGGQIFCAAHGKEDKRVGKDPRWRERSKERRAR